MIRKKCKVIISVLLTIALLIQTNIGFVSMAYADETTITETTQLTNQESNIQADPANPDPVLQEGQVNQEINNNNEVANNSENIANPFPDVIENLDINDNQPAYTVVGDTYVLTANTERMSTKDGNVYIKHVTFRSKADLVQNPEHEVTENKQPDTTQINQQNNIETPTVYQTDENNNDSINQENVANIDNELTEDTEQAIPVDMEVYNPYPIKNKGGLFNAGFSPESDQGLLFFSHKKASLLLNPVEPNTVSGEVYSNSILYSNIYPDTDFRYTVENEMLKEEIIVQRYTGKNNFNFQLSVSEAVYELTPEGDIIFYSPDSTLPLFFMPKPFVTDSNGDRCDSVDYILSEDGVLKISIDSEWLSNAAYPIVIDPTIYVCDATFARNSTAYKQNATSVSTSVPRYELGRFNQAIMVESGTTNLLTANQSSVQTDLTGLDATSQCGGHTLSRDSTTGWHGSASAKLVCGYSSGPQWISIRTYPTKTTVSPSTAYTASVYTKVNAAGKTQSIKIDWFDSSNNWLSCSTASSIIGCTSWQRVSVSATSPSNAAKAALELTVDNALYNNALWWDGAQFEQKAYVTSWHLPGTNRATESITIPTAGIFKKGSWTTELTYKPISSPNPSQAKTLWYISSGYCLTVETNGSIKLAVNGSSISTSSNFVTPGNIYSIMAAGNGSVIRLCINGSQIGSDVNYTEPSGNLYPAMNLGCYQYSVFTFKQQADGLFDDVRFSNCARTLAEHQAAYQSNQPLPIDSYTTFKDEFDGNLQALASGQGCTGKESYWNYTDLDLGDGWNASINTYNLNMVLQKNFFSIPGRGLPIGESITYNSTAEGMGWQLASNARVIELQNGDVVLTDTDGSSHTFTYNSGNYTPPPGIYLTLHKDGPGNFTITDKKRNTYVYENNKPKQYYDLNNNITNFSYGADGKLSQIIDPSNRTITYTYAAQLGVLANIKDPNNRTYGFSYSQTLYIHSPILIIKQ